MSSGKPLSADFPSVPEHPGPFMKAIIGQLKGLSGGNEVFPLRTGARNKAGGGGHDLKPGVLESEHGTGHMPGMGDEVDAMDTFTFENIRGVLRVGHGR